MKKYSCGNGDGMFEDAKNGNWIEYLEYNNKINELKKIIEITHNMCDKITYPTESELNDLKEMCYNALKQK